MHCGCDSDTCPLDHSTPAELLSPEAARLAEIARLVREADGPAVEDLLAYAEAVGLADDLDGTVELDGADVTPAHAVAGMHDAWDRWGFGPGAFNEDWDAGRTRAERIADDCGHPEHRACVMCD